MAVVLRIDIEHRTTTAADGRQGEHFLFTNVF